MESTSHPPWATCPGWPQAILWGSPRSLNGTGRSGSQYPSHRLHGKAEGNPPIRPDLASLTLRRGAPGCRRGAVISAPLAPGLGDLLCHPHCLPQALGGFAKTQGLGPMAPLPASARSHAHTLPARVSMCTPMGAGHRNPGDRDQPSRQGPHHGDAGQALASWLLSPSLHGTRRGCSSAPALLPATPLSNQFTTTRRGGW